MELKSVSRPIGESAHAVRKPPPIAERRLGAAPDKSIARTRTTMKRLAIGKSKRPLVRLGMETVIHNPDERTHIVETDEAPWRMVCALTIDGPARSSSPILVARIPVTRLADADGIVRPGRPKGTAVTSDGRYAVVSGGPRLDPSAPTSGTVWVIDLHRRAVVATVTGVGNDPYGLTILEDRPD